MAKGARRDETTDDDGDEGDHDGESSRDLARAGLRHRPSGRAASPSPGAASAAAASATAGLTADETKKREKKIQKIIQRVTMSLGMIFAFLFVIWLGHPYLVALVVIIQVGCFRELVNVRYHFREANNKPTPLFRTTQWSLFWLSMMHSYGRSLTKLGLISSTIRKFPKPMQWYLFEMVKYRSLLTCIGFLCIFVSFVINLKRSLLRRQIGNLVWTIWVLALTVTQVQGAIVLIYGGICWFILPCGLVIANDCFAYICGMSMGGRLTKAVFLKISPNKTWEGFIGAIFCTMAFAWIFADIMSWFPWVICPQSELSLYGYLECERSTVFTKRKVPVGLDEHVLFDLTASPFQLHAMVLACVASIVAPFGGFLASGIKRAYDIKDFGDLIPGHGGFMDRMDCQLLMLLCTYVYHQTFFRDTDPSEYYVLNLLSAMPDEGKRRVYSQLGEMLAIAEAGRSGR